MLLIWGNGETAGGLPPSAFNSSANQVCRLGTLYGFTRRLNGFVVYEAAQYHQYARLGRGMHPFD